LHSYQLLNNLDGRGNGIDAAFNYQLGFKKDKNRLLTFSYRYYDFSNRQYNNVDVLNQVIDNTNPSLTALKDYQQQNTGGSSEQTAQIDLVYPLKKVTIEAGVKAILRDNSSNFEFLSVNTAGDFVLDATRSNNFDNKQNVYGIYNTYQFNIQKWGVKTGVRVEQTDIKLGNQINNNSINFIPSISVNRKFKNNSSINFGFTSRIQRPGINQLNPFVDRSNPNFESSGNPDLKPMIGQSFEATYSRFKKATLNIGFRAIIIDNLIMPQVSTDLSTNITRTSFANTGGAKLLGLNINVNYPFTPKLRLALGAMGNYGMVHGEVNGVKIDKNGLMRKAFTSLTYRASKTLQATGSVNYNGPSLSLQGTTNSFVASSFSVNKDFFNNKLTVSFAANNAFSKYRKAINYTTGPNFTQESYNQNYQRNFTTSINYRFGKLKDAIKKNKKGISNNDVSEGSNL
ncbi:MAG: TonB-dependent receptor, partial [Flavobacteriales bacterium]